MPRAVKDTAHQPAALWRRLAAGFYDLFPLLAIWFGIGFAAVGVRGLHAVPPTTWWFDTLLLIAAFLYFALSWRRGGQTLGMRAWKIRVLTGDGRPMTWPTATLRFAVALLSVGVALIGVLWMLVDPQRRMWHDMASRTRMVDDRR